jgi:hypothetical protein
VEAIPATVATDQKHIKHKPARTRLAAGSDRMLMNDFPWISDFIDFNLSKVLDQYQLRPLFVN